MFRKHSRIIAAIALGFFTWTSGGVFTVANAAVDAVKKGNVKEEQLQQQKKPEGAEERCAAACGSGEVGKRFRAQPRPHQHGLRLTGTETFCQKFAEFKDTGTDGRGSDGETTFVNVLLNLP